VEPCPSSSVTAGVLFVLSYIEQIHVHDDDDDDDDDVVY